MSLFSVTRGKSPIILNLTNNGAPLFSYTTEQSKILRFKRQQNKTVSLTAHRNTFQLYVTALLNKSFCYNYRIIFAQIYLLIGTTNLHAKLYHNSHFSAFLQFRWQLIWYRYGFHFPGSVMSSNAMWVTLGLLVAKEYRKSPRDLLDELEDWLNSVKISAKADKLSATCESTILTELPELPRKNKKLTGQHVQSSVHPTLCRWVHS